MTDTWIDRARARMRAGRISHQDLADQLGCTRGAVGHYLSGRRRPSLRQLAGIARALQLDPAWLLHGNDADAVREPAAEYGQRDFLVPVIGEGRPRRGRRPAALLRVPTPARNCYAMPVTDDAYSPRLFAGETLLIDPGGAPQAGDEVVIQRRAGPPDLHTFIARSGGSVVVENISGSRNRKRIRESEIRFMHKIIAVFRAGEELRQS